MILDDKAKKKIIADYVLCQNYRETARKNGVHHSTVKRLVDRVDNADFIQKATQKREENTQDVLAYMQSQHETQTRIIGKLFTAIEQKAENPDMFTSIKDLATALGIVVDKALKVAEIKHMSAGNDQTQEADGLSKALSDLAGEMDADQ